MPVSAALSHLSPDMRTFYARIDRRYRLLDHHKRVLILACEAHDRAVQARELIAREGITIGTARGGARVHPAVNVERDSRLAFLRALRELGLADEAEAPRPPRPAGRYGR